MPGRQQPAVGVQDSLKPPVDHRFMAPRELARGSGAGAEPPYTEQLLRLDLKGWARQPPRAGPTRAVAVRSPPHSASLLTSG